MTNTPKTFSDAEAYAASLGIVITPAERGKIAQIQTAEAERLQKLQGETAAPDLAARWNKFYPTFLQSILSVGEAILTFSQTVIVALGVPLVLVLLLIVEVTRVTHGIALFETDAALASFAAISLVVANLTLEITIHHLEHKAGYHAERGRKWSLRLWMRNMLYTLGIGEAWQEQLLSPAARYKKLLRLVTFSILALALVGSMRSVIGGISGTWYNGLVSIVTQSSLLELFTWAGGLLFAAAAVLTAQGLSGYIAIRTVEIVAAMNASQDAAFNPNAAAIDEAAANAVLALIHEKQAAKEAKAAQRTPAAAPVSIQIPAPMHEAAHEVTIDTSFLSPMQRSTNGNGNGQH